MMWGGIIIPSISSYPVSTSKLLFSCPHRVKICIMLNGDVDLASLTPDKPTTTWLLHMGWLQMGRGGGSPSHPPSPQTQHCTHPPEMGAGLLDLLRVKKPCMHIPERGASLLALAQSKQTLYPYSRDGWQVCWLCPERLCTTTHVGFFRVRFLLEPGTNLWVTTGEQASFTFSAAFLHQIHCAFKLPHLTQLHGFDHLLWFCLNLPCRTKPIQKWMIR